MLHSQICMATSEIVWQDQGPAIQVEGGAVDPTEGGGDSSDSDESEEDEKLEVNLEAGELHWVSAHCILLTTRATVFRYTLKYPTCPHLLEPTVPLRVPFWARRRTGVHAHVQVVVRLHAFCQQVRAARVRTKGA